MSSFPNLKHEDTRRLVFSVLFVGFVSVVTHLISPPWAVLAAICASVLVGILYLMHYHRSTALQIVKLSEHIQDLHFLHSRIELRKPLPYLTSWSASPALASRLYSLILKEKPEYVFELGSGVSTVVMAYAMERVGSGRVVSVDHDEVYAEKTRAELKRHQLDHLATVIYAPLSEIASKKAASGTDSGAGMTRWYDLSGVPDLNGIDMLVVDGPPLKTGKDARLPAFNQLLPFLSSGSIVVIDDSARAEEQTSVAAWTGVSDTARSEDIPSEKGVSVRFLH